MAIRVQLPNGEIGEFPDDMPHEEIESVLQKQFPHEGESEAPSSPLNRAEGDFDKTIEPPETTGIQGLKDDAKDLFKSSLKGATGFLRRLPGNVGEIASDIVKHPIKTPPHIAQQVLAGAADLAKGTLNLPHEALKELGKKELIPEWLKKYNELPFTHIPEDTGVEKALGLEPTKKSDELLRALPAIYGGVKALEKPAGKAAEAFKGPDLKAALKETQNKVTAETAKSGKIFDTVESEVEKRGISNVPVDKSVIKQAKKYLADTPANKVLIKRAKTGDYSALRDLQADLRVKGEKSLSSALAAENKMGEEIFSTRDQINSSIQTHFEKTGQEDLAKLLNKARDDYREIKQTYFSSPALAKVFGKSQKVPKNPITLLTEDSTEMNKFMSAHPEIKDALAKALKHGSKKKFLKSVGKYGLGALGAEEVGRAIHK